MSTGGNPYPGFGAFLREEMSQANAGTPQQQAQPPQQAQVPPAANQPTIPSSTPPAVPAPAPTAPAAPSKSTVVRDYLRTQFRYDLPDDLSDEDLAPQIGQILQQLGETRRQLDEEATRARHWEAQIAEMRSRQTATPAPAAPAAQAQPPVQQPADDNRWRELAFNPEWEFNTEWSSEENAWVPKGRYTSPQAAIDRNAYDRAARERARALTENPWRAAWESGGRKEIERIQKEINERLDRMEQATVQKAVQHQAQVRELDEIDAYFRDNQRLFFICDDNGQALRDPATNSYLMSDYGKVYQGAAREAQDSYGISDRKKIHQYATSQLSIYHNWRQSQQPQQPAQPTPAQPATPPPAAPAPDMTSAQVNEMQKQRFLDRAKPTVDLPSNPGGTIAEAARRGEPLNPRLSFREMAYQDPDNAEILGNRFEG